jgi:hypothetical protein
MRLLRSTRTCQAYVKSYTVGRIKAGQRDRVPLSLHVSTQRAHYGRERASLSRTVQCQGHTTCTLSVAARDCKNYLRTAFVGGYGGRCRKRAFTRHFMILK